MAAQPEMIRTQIESTREELAYDIDRLADRTSPRRIARRRWDSVRDRVTDLKDRVMGVSDDAAHRMRHASHDTADRVRDAAEDAAAGVRHAPEAVARGTQGNPIAAGLIAFGAGLLVASLLPETEAERRLAHEVAERAEDLAEPLRETGRQVASDLGESVTQAAHEVRDTAAEAVSTTAQRARDTA
jgi:gas vesicle protein